MRHHISVFCKDDNKSKACVERCRTPPSLKCDPFDITTNHGGVPARNLPGVITPPPCDARCLYTSVSWVAPQDANFCIEFDLTLFEVRDGESDGEEKAQIQVIPETSCISGRFFALSPQSLLEI